MITVAAIQKLVADHYGIRVESMISARRARAIARPRQVAMYLARQLTTRSLPELGEAFGGRHHTTVMHGIETVEHLIATKPRFAAEIARLRALAGTVTEHAA